MEGRHREDLETLFGVNPLSPEVSFTVKADYASEASLRKIKAQVEKMGLVEAVAAPDAEMVDTMNTNIEKAAYVLGGIALVLLVISFVLINNTVRPTIYSRRFTIHTMQLVGATNRFIRRPMVGNNLLSGVLAGLIASACRGRGRTGRTADGPRTSRHARPVVAVQGNSGRIGDCLARLYARWRP